jgi:hypothetical protein
MDPAASENAAKVVLRAAVIKNAAKELFCCT